MERCANVLNKNDEEKILLFYDLVQINITQPTAIIKSFFLCHEIFNFLHFIVYILLYYYLISTLRNIIVF